MEKTPSESKVEWFKVIQTEDINASDRLFGGRLLAWMDEVAGIAAIRHSGHNVTTAAIDSLRFKKGLYLGDLVVIESRVTYVGNTSMEVRVDVYREDVSTSLRYPVNRAFFTEVCIDENGNPVKVPFELKIESENERADWEGAKLRIKNRKERNLQGF